MSRIVHFACLPAAWLSAGTLPRLLATLLVTAVAAGTGSCASAARSICNPRAASKLGADDAQRWDGERSGLARVNICRKEYTAVDFEADYADGRRAALARQCTGDRARNLGQKAARRNDYQMQDRNRLQLCAEVEVSVPELEQAYTQGFQDETCNQDHVVTLARRWADALAAADTRWAAVCTPESRDAWVAVYQSAYAQALDRACRPPAMSGRGVALARQRTGLDVALTAVDRCPPELQADAVRALQESYDAESQRQARFREEQRHQQEMAAREQERAEWRRQRDALARERAAEVNRRMVVVKGERVSLACQVEDRHAVLHMFNPSRGFVSFSADVQVQGFDSAGRPVWADHGYAHFSAFSGGSDTDRLVGYVPETAASCVVMNVQLR